MVLCVMEISGNQFQQVLRRGDILLHIFTKYAPAFCDPNRGVDDSLGCKSMSVASLDAENITRQVKGSNLTRAIREKIKRGTRTPFDLVLIIRRVNFSENFRFLLGLKLAPQGFLSD